MDFVCVFYILCKNIYFTYLICIRDRTHLTRSSLHFRLSITSCRDSNGSQEDYLVTCSICWVWDLFCKLCSWCVSRSNSLRLAVETKPSGMFQLFTHCMCVCACVFFVCKSSHTEPHSASLLWLVAKMGCWFCPQVHPTGCCGCRLGQIDAHFKDGRWSWIRGETEVYYQFSAFSSPFTASDCIECSPRPPLWGQCQNLRCSCDITAEGWGGLFLFK